MDSINSFFNGIFNANNYKLFNQNNYTSLDDEKIVDIWSDVDNDPLLESIQREFGVPFQNIYNEDETLTQQLKKPMPRMISLSGHTYVSLDDTLCDYETIHNNRVLTSKKYLKKEWNKNIKYLDFVNQSYISHLKERLKFFRKALKSSFLLFINAFFPNCMTYSGTDEIILLSENILDKYSDVLNKRAEKATNESQDLQKP